MTTDELLLKLPSHIGRNRLYNDKHEVIGYASDYKEGGDIGWFYLHNDGKKAAEKMARDHRTLQSNMFKLFMAYIKILAENAKTGWFDERNEYACRTSEKMLNYLDSINYPY